MNIKGRKTATTLERQNCVKCKKDKSIRDHFYKTSSNMYPNGTYPLCKACIVEKIPTGDNPNGTKYKSVVHEILADLNKPFLYDIYTSATEESKTSGKDTFGLYMKNVQMHQYKSLTWKDSIFEPKQFVKTESKYKSALNDDNTIDIESLKEKYGYGYPDEEYLLFEKKYWQLKPSFQLLTTMHEEYFKEYCINKVKETLAKSKGDFKEAKEWAAMVKDVAEAGKLKPSQMSKADLSGGLDTFGQLARMVEENNEIMPLLPQFVEKPKDKVDVVLWCFINYVRSLKALPEVEYKEIYEFYEQRREEYESHLSDETNFSEESVDANG